MSIARTVCVLVPLAGLALSAHAQTAPVFRLVGALPGTNTYSSGYGVSEDGSVVVGHSGNNYYYGSSSHSFRWTRSGGIEDLNPLAPASGAYAVSADGLIAVGGEISGSEHAVRYMPDTSSAADQLYHGGQCFGISRDGTIAVGYSTASGGGGGGGGGGGFRPHRATRYPAESGSVEFIDTPASGVVAPTSSESFATSNDGSVVVGWGVFGGVQRGFRWTPTGGMTPITPAGGVAYSVSGDGSVIVGDFVSGTVRHAFRWTASSGLVDLGTLPGNLRSSAYAVSNDGSTIVGMAQQNNGVGAQRAFIWRADIGLQDLNVVLGAAMPAGYTLTEGRSLNSNGTVIAGGSRTPTGGVEAWVVNAPQCISAAASASPADQTLYSGANLNLAVTPAGFGPFQFQWRKNGVNIEGATAATLAFAPALMDDSGSYDCIISGFYGSSGTTPAQIAVECLGDLDRNAQVDDMDFVGFAQAYDVLLCEDALMPAGCPADFTKDGHVDDTDFVQFAVAYDQLVCH